MGQEEKTARELIPPHLYPDTLRITDDELDTLLHFGIPLPLSYLEDARTALNERGLLEQFDLAFAPFQSAIGDDLRAGHVLICADRVCEAAGQPPLEEF
jgi:hypothetical protein